VVPVGEMKYVCNPKMVRNDNDTQVVERILSRNGYTFIITQRTAEWFLFRGFHLTVTMASQILNSTAKVKDGRIYRCCYVLGSVDPDQRKE
jgi:hypothetical protein